jgi:hypothetical protein
MDMHWPEPCCDDEDSDGRNIACKYTNYPGAKAPAFFSYWQGVKILLDKMWGKNTQEIQR